MLVLLTCGFGREDVGLRFNLVMRLFRVKQWIKNLFIFAPIVFAQKIFSGVSLIKVLFAVFLFCIVTSCVYMLNDILDIENDRKHPVKKLRPIASGEVSKKEVFTMVAILLPITIILGLFLDMNFGIVMILYLFNNYLYSYFLKHLVIVDVISIAIGFVLRVIAGAEVIDVYISPWILMCTLFLALFLGLSKRKSEILSLGNDATQFRKNLEEYSIEFIDNMISIVVAMTLVAYSLYTFFSQNEVYLMACTIPIVIYGVFRYQYLVQMKNKGEVPEDTILKDKPLLLTIGLWCVVVLFALYL